MPIFERKTIWHDVTYAYILEYDDWTMPCAFENETRRIDVERK